MDESLSRFLESINSTDSSIRYKDSGGDETFFNACADKLNELNVKTILDICCGTSGQFVEICTTKYNMNAYGIDPRTTTKNNLYTGTIENVISNQNLLDNFKFDCISIQNTLHGKHWTDDEIIDILKFMKRFSKFIVITDPIHNLNVNLNGFTESHVFDGSHWNGTVIHKIYKVE
jgi:precorrin-6B methylase 2